MRLLGLTHPPGTRLRIRRAAGEYPVGVVMLCGDRAQSRVTGADQVYTAIGAPMAQPLTRRELLALSAAAPLAAMALPDPAVKPGIDIFSLRSQNWTPFQNLDYCAAHGAKVVHFSEVRFIGSL